jgi:hypothetical protein
LSANLLFGSGCAGFGWAKSPAPAKPLTLAPPVGGTAAEFAQLIDTETKMWGDVGRAANVKLE